MIEVSVHLLVSNQIVIKQALTSDNDIISNRSGLKPSILKVRYIFEN